MYDLERGWSLSFAACGFLITYYVGVDRCISERAPRLFSDARQVFGASAGSLYGVCLLGGIPMGMYLLGAGRGGVDCGRPVCGRPLRVARCPVGPRLDADTARSLSAAPAGRCLLRGVLSPGRGREGGAPGGRPATLTLPWRPGLIEGGPAAPRDREAGHRGRRERATQEAEGGAGPCGFRLEGARCSELSCPREGPTCPASDPEGGFGPCPRVGAFFLLGT